MASERFTIEFFKYHVYTHAHINRIHQCKINIYSLPVLVTGVLIQFRYILPAFPCSWSGNLKVAVSTVESVTMGQLGAG